MLVAYRDMKTIRMLADQLKQCRINYLEINLTKEANLYIKIYKTMLAKHGGACL
jgi:hypothetical protein